VFGDYIIDRSVFAGKQPQFDFQIIVSAAPGCPPTPPSRPSRRSSTATQRQMCRPQPVHRLADRATRRILNFIYALLGMSIFIAVLGIVLTLLLGVYERRRELGLMRAIGTTRPQIRGTIRWEAVITAVLGALMGTGLGVSLGWIVSGP